MQSTASQAAHTAQSQQVVHQLDDRTRVLEEETAANREAIEKLQTLSSSSQVKTTLQTVSKFKSLTKKDRATLKLDTFNKHEFVAYLQAYYQANKSSWLPNQTGAAYTQCTY